MLSRDKLNVVTDALKEHHKRQQTTEVQDALNEDRAVFEQMSWGGAESSMIPFEQLPVAHAMIDRLKEKYGSSFKKNGGTDKVLQHLEHFLRQQIKAAGNDKDKAWQLTAALNTLTHPDSHFHINRTSQMHHHKLRELLAYMWIAANDVNAVLRPHLEHEMQQITDPTLQKQKRMELMQTSLVNDFLFTLFEIRRAHNDTPETINDRVKDHQSCVNGTFGRMVFKLCPNNVVTTLTYQNVTLAELEAKSLKAAKTKREAEYHLLIPVMLDYIVSRLASNEIHPEIVKSVYRCMTAFVVDTPQNENDIRGYSEFLKILSKHKKLFVKYACEHIEGLDPKSPDIQKHLREMISTVIADLKPDVLFSKDYFLACADDLDRRFVEERSREAGAKLMQGDELLKAMRDNESIAIRSRIRQLSYKFKSLDVLIDNEVKRGMLAFTTLDLTNPDDMEKWKSIQDKITKKIEFLHARIENSLSMCVAISLICEGEGQHTVINSNSRCISRVFFRCI